MTTAEAVLTCVDGSIYTDSVCQHAAWASTRLDAPVHLIHISTPPLSYDGPSDLSGSLQVGEMGSLLEKLTEVDEARGKLDLRKGEVIVQHAREVLVAAGADLQEIIHRRGSLIETLTEYESSAQMIVLGKRGEHADFATLHLGANLERVIRASRVPVLVAARTFTPIEQMVIAYDGGPSIEKAIDYLVSSPLLRGLTCHLLHVGRANNETVSGMDAVVKRLAASGFEVKTHIQMGRPDEVIAAYCETHGINLLVMGAYGHSRIRTMVIGSTTSAMIRSCLMPVLLFR